MLSRVRSLAAVLLLAAGPAAAQWSVNDLMAALAARGSADASFTEQRYVPILDTPVQSTASLTIQHSFTQAAVSEFLE